MISKLGQIKEDIWAEAGWFVIDETSHDFMNEKKNQLWDAVARIAIIQPKSFIKQQIQVDFENDISI